MPKKAVCRVCKKELDIINPIHLKTHGITIKEYKERFPNSELISEGFRKKLSGRVPWCAGRKINFEKYPNFGMKGKKHTKKSKKKMSKTRIEKRITPWNKGLTKETDERLSKSSKKMSIAKKKNWEDPKYHENMVEAHLGMWGEHPEDFGEKISEGKETWLATHNRMAKENMGRFEKEGFRVIPIDLEGFPRPDFVAIKDNMIYAVELEVKHPTPKKLKKYKDTNYFDDIIWIILDRE